MITRSRLFWLSVFVSIAPFSNPVGYAQVEAEKTAADVKPDIRDLNLRDWQPRSMLKTNVTCVNRPSFAVIDVHDHLGGVLEKIYLTNASNLLGLSPQATFSGLMIGCILISRAERQVPDENKY